jgi:hypothetical protein
MPSNSSRRMTLVAPLLVMLIGLGGLLWFVVAGRSVKSGAARRVGSGGAVGPSDPGRPEESPPTERERAADAGVGRSARTGQPVPRFVIQEPPPPLADPGETPGGTPVKFSGDRAGIIAALKDSMPEIRQCYREWLKAEPNLQGRLSIEFQLSASASEPSEGRISNIGVTDSTLRNAAMEGCVMSAFEQRAFEAPARNFKSRFNVVLSTDPSTGPPH